MKTMASVWVVGAIACLLAAGLPPALDAATEAELQSAVFRASRPLSIAVRIGATATVPATGRPQSFGRARSARLSGVGPSFTPMAGS
jgi:hypothetical protein